MRGFWLTMEAVLACIVMALFIIAIAKSHIEATRDMGDNEMAYDILKGLDDSGALRGYAAAMDYAGLDSEVEAPGYSHSVMICDYGGTCAGSEPDAGNAWAGSYFIAGQSEYKPLEIRLYLWKRVKA